MYCVSKESESSLGNGNVWLWQIFLHQPSATLTILYVSFQGPLANGKDGPSLPCICGFSTMVVVPEVHPRGDRPAIDHGAVLSAMLVVGLARVPDN